MQHPAPAAPRRCRVLRSREMFLALHEIRRGLVRFGLLAMAISLSLFLVLFQQALQDGLLTSFVGALRNQSAKPGSCPACSCRTQSGAWNDMLAVCPGHAPASANGSVSHPVTSELPDGRRGELIWIPWWRHHRPPPGGPGRDREGFSGAVSGHVSRRRIGRSVRVRAPRTVGPPPSPSSSTTPTPRSTGSPARHRRRRACCASGRPRGHRDRAQRALTVRARKAGTATVTCSVR